jgi:DNA-binding NtrC family response regulator
MFRILIVGDDCDVIRGSFRLLQRRYAVSLSSTRDLVKRVSEMHYDLLIVCHTIPLRKAASLIEVASDRCPWLEIIWLAEWQTTASAESERKVVCIDGVVRPSWEEAIDEMAAKLGYRPRPLPQRPAISRVSS